MTGPRVAVEKRKWDGSVSTRSPGWLLDDLHGRRCWLVPDGAPCERPRLGRVEPASGDVIYAAAGAWWVVSVRMAEDGAPGPYRVDAALSPGHAGNGALRWIDLDLDLILDGADIELRDHADFRRRAREMAYPPEVCEGAWSGVRDAVCRQAAGTWPFDGSLAVRLGDATRALLGRDPRPAAPAPIPG